MSKYDKCYECPNYHHGGAFGNPKYRPKCKGKNLPMVVDDRNHASPDTKRINCVHHTRNKKKAPRKERF